MIERDATLAELVERGLDPGRIRFGIGGGLEHLADLAEAGSCFVGPGGTDASIAAILTNDRTSVELVVGSVLRGGRLLSLPAPGRAADLPRYARTLIETCEAHGARAVVVRDDLAPVLAELGVPTRSHQQVAAAGSAPLAEPRTAGFELVQFSSGSTGRPKGVTLGADVIAANVSAIIERITPQPGDVAVSWLPLSHDMGLIGMLLTSIVSMAPELVGGGSLVLIEPEAFLRRPGLWADALSRYGGTLTASPCFGFELASRLSGQPDISLDRLRCAIVGGDIVRASSLDAYVAANAATGLDPRALCPAYGLAELGLAATMTPPDVHWRDATVDSAAIGELALRFSEPGPGSTTLVSSGPPLEGYGVVLGTAEPAPGADGGIRPVGVHAPASGSDAATGRPFADASGVVATGDIGFTDGDWVYICGRSDDSFAVNGRNVYAPAIEEAVGRVRGVRPGRVTAVGTPTGGWVLAFEWRGTAAGGGPDQARRDARRAGVQVAGASPLEVIVLEPGQLPMTSSGKIQRNEVRRRWLAGTLGAS